MKRKSLFMLLIAFAMGVMLSGCPKTVKVSEEDKKKYSFQEYCKVVLDHTATAKKVTLNDDVKKQMTEQCTKIEKGIDDQLTQAKTAQDKIDAAKVAFVKHLITTCEGKKGQEWLDCNTKEMDNATKKADEAAK
jgi:hypothetical protein